MKIYPICIDELANWRVGWGFCFFGIFDLEFRLYGIDLVIPCGEYNDDYSSFLFDWFHWKFQVIHKRYETCRTIRIINEFPFIQYEYEKDEIESRTKALDNEREHGKQIMEELIDHLKMMGAEGCKIPIGEFIVTVKKKKPKME